MSEPPERAEEVRRLAERLLAPLYAIPGHPPQTARLVPGVPEGLPLEVPVPPGATLAGGVVRHEDGRLANADLLIDSEAPADALHFYDEAFPAQGWNPAPDMATGQNWGFQRAGPPSRTFCRGPAGPYVSVTAGEREVRVHVELTHAGPCAQPPGGGPRNAERLPALRAPHGAMLRPGGGSFGGDQVSSTATAEDDRSAADLEAHFAEQLQLAGWVRSGGGSGAGAAWSTWRLPGEGEWHGLLVAVELLRPHQRALLVRADAGAGWAGAILAGWTSVSRTA